MVNIHRTRKNLSFKKAIAALSYILCVTSVAASTLHLDGIGYREAALQTAKTSFFRSEDASGI